jgi:asparagine synthase (glutamine-hydrolysing)
MDMCGIVGAAWSVGTAPLSRDEISRMAGVIRHRGPDADGFWPALDAFPLSASPGAALGHRRLSIIDLAGGAQPLSNEDETVWVTFNGEIYNYRELQPELEQLGHKFRTDSDTEVIVHAYEQWGDACVTRFRGMFAFAVWDDRRKRLFMARDRLGKKPLVYRVDGGRIVFASELKSLLELKDLPRRIDPIALDDFLTYQYVPHPSCILEGFCKLPPAHTAVFAEGRLEVSCYWTPPYLEPDETKTLADWSAELRSTLTEAVRLRMRSDVPLGAFLSGGVDSTITAGLMQSLSTRPVKTFSIGFPVPEYDEREFARLAAKHLGTEHHEQVVEASALSILPKLVHHYDEPFADSSAIPMMYLSEMTRAHVTVALSGDGGDELFAGYERYQAVRLGEQIDRLPKFVRDIAGWKLWQNMPASVRQRSWRRRAKRFLAGLAATQEERYLKWIVICDRDLRHALYTRETRARIGDHNPAELLGQAMRLAAGRDIVTQTTCADVLTYLPCDILTKVDIATMAYGLEARCPFLDHHVAELAARMPMRFKMPFRKGKQILIDTFADLLPEPIRNRRKMGFGVPLDVWFRGELRKLLEEHLLDARSLDRGWFQPDAVRGLVREHVDGTWNHSARLWALLVFEMWQREYVDG